MGACVSAGDKGAKTEDSATAAPPAKAKAGPPPGAEVGVVLLGQARPQSSTHDTNQTA